MTSGISAVTSSQASLTSGSIVHDVTSGEASSDVVTTESFGESSEDAGVVLYIPWALAFLILL